jgi:hypothetical protein
MFTVAIEYGLFKNIGYVDVCSGFEMFKVKVPIKFRQVGFSPRREGPPKQLLNKSARTYLILHPQSFWELASLAYM